MLRNNRAEGNVYDVILVTKKFSARFHESCVRKRRFYGKRFGKGVWVVMPTRAPPNQALNRANRGCQIRGRKGAQHVSQKSTGKERNCMDVRYFLSDVPLTVVWWIDDEAVMLFGTYAVWPPARYNALVPVVLLR